MTRLILLKICSNWPQISPIADHNFFFLLCTRRIINVSIFEFEYHKLLGLASCLQIGFQKVGVKVGIKVGIIVINDPKTQKFSV